MRKPVRQVIVLLALLALTSCAYPIRNQPLTTMDELAGYRWSNLPAKSLPDTLVIVSASGGGTRAAALELSVLRALAKIQLTSGGNLADRIDVLSSVSGGSVTAAYFALKGTDGFDTLEENFIRQPGIDRIAAAELPFGLLRAAAPSRERIDFLIDYLDHTLFTEQPTYGALIKQSRRPLLVLNAADMVEETPFAFTQPNFDLLCSDLSSVKLSTAVAASAAFPVALSPVTLKDYSTCQAQKDWAQAKRTSWPPAWVDQDLASDWYIAPDRNSRGRVEAAYAMGSSATPQKGYIHLLDGGIADNLGVAEPIRILTTNAPSPGYLDDIANGDIKNIIFIMINARSFATSDLDQKPDTPGIVDMLMGSVSSSIDRATLGSAALLRNVLREKLLNEAKRLRSSANDAREKARPEAANDFERRASNLETAAANAKLIPVDFDAIQEPVCRQDFHNIKTSWQNTPAEIDGLLLVGDALMHQAPDFPAALRLLGGTDPGAAPSVAAACAALKK